MKKITKILLMAVISYMVIEEPRLIENIGFGIAKVLDEVKPPQGPSVSL